MPVSDFRCPVCGHEDLNRFYPMPRYTPQHDRIDPLPTCPACEADLGQLVSMEHAPTQMRHDVLKESVELDLDGTIHRFSSISEMRALSEDSLIRARNKEGNPYVWRHLEQDRQNRHTNALAGTEFELNKAAPRVKPGRLRTTRNLPIDVRSIPDPS